MRDLCVPLRSSCLCGGICILVKVLVSAHPGRLKWRAILAALVITVKSAMSRPRLRCSPLSVVHSLVVLLLVSALAACAPVPARPEVAEKPAEIPVAACPICPVCPSPLAPVCPLPTPPQAAAGSAKPPSYQAVRWQDLPGWQEDDLLAAWPALRLSCKTLIKQGAWRQVCEEAEELAKMPPDTLALRDYLESRFTPWQVINSDDSREGLVTGYYEPLIKGARQPGKVARYPVLAPPDDMLTVDLSELYPELKNLRLRGRLEGNKVVPYYSRAELRQRPGKALFWAHDPVELVFLQVQGSGRIELEDGSRVRVGYADQNGHPYQSLGRWLVDKGELRLDQASMEGIKTWVREHPQRLDELLDANPSLVFFRKLPDTRPGEIDGPVGAMGLPLSAGRSVAVDPRSLPLGAPIFLATTWPNSPRPLQRLMLAQDTGGAIKGGVRADFFWGFGAEAGAQAGRMKQKGRIWLLLPRDIKPAALGLGG